MNLINTNDLKINNKDKQTKLMVLIKLVKKKL